MRILPQLCALTVISFSLGGCSCSDKNSNTGASTGGGGDGGGGAGGMVAMGGTGGDMGGTGGTPVTGGTGGMPAVGGGGMGGTGGTGGTPTGGTGGTPPVVPGYCETDAAMVNPLPFTVDESTVVFFNQIGLHDDTMDGNLPFDKINNPNCDEVYTAVVTPADAGDGAVSDASTPVVDASVPPSDASVMSDASVSDAAMSDASPMDAAMSDASPIDGGMSGDGSVPAAACIGFHYTEAAGDWNGVVFQSNDLTARLAGAGPGLCIAPGATKVTFMARADRATTMKIGEIWEGVESYLPLTTTWTAFSVPIMASFLNYNDNPQSKGTPGGVWKLFSIVADGQSAAEAKVFVKNIQYQM
ncbi:MAG TPA: hypothetical protein VL137_08275 [Polyangiaceae bacterium]|jgi:hypothetical protein|nr:hypothetical protein [Polyangiaceae bacterium]